eukprot:5922165-Pleurochrysis_carterae.AAC.1
MHARSPSFADKPASSRPHAGVFGTCVAQSLCPGPVLITCGNAQDDGADKFDGLGDTVGNFDVHVGVTLRDAVGREEAA